MKNAILAGKLAGLGAPLAYLFLQMLNYFFALSIYLSAIFGIMLSAEICSWIFFAKKTYQLHKLFFVDYPIGLAKKIQFKKNCKKILGHYYMNELTKKEIVKSVFALESLFISLFLCLFILVAELHILRYFLSRIFILPILPCSFLSLTLISSVSLLLFNKSNFFYNETYSYEKQTKNNRKILVYLALITLFHIPAIFALVYLFINVGKIAFLLPIFFTVLSCYLCLCLLIIIIRVCLANQVVAGLLGISLGALGGYALTDFTQLLLVPTGIGIISSASIGMIVALILPLLISKKFLALINNFLFFYTKKLQI